MNDKEAKERILKAIVSSKYRWRTLKGIAKDSGVPVQQAHEVLERGEPFMRARKANARGERLYTTRSRYDSEVTLSERIIAALTNRLPE